MWIKIGISLLSAAIGTLLYHIAGKGGFKNAKLLRRLGCPLMALGGVYLPWVSWNWGLLWAIPAFLGLSWGAMSTYHDYLAPDGSSENWLCWLMTGFCYGLSALPLVILSGHWVTFAIRTVILAAGIMLIRETTGKVEIEELGSGGLYEITMALLLI